MYAVCFYDANPERFPLVPEAYPRHRAYLDQFALAGEVVAIGTFSDPGANGSMAVFRSRDAAERFTAGDPFVREGLVGAIRILDWDPLEFPAG